MTRTVYKYTLWPSTPTVVRLPQQAKVLHVGSQDEAPTLWAEVDPLEPPENRFFYVYGTGHVIEDGLRHVGTCQTAGGFVWHVFEKHDAGG